MIMIEISFEIAQRPRMDQVQQLAGQRPRRRPLSIMHQGVPFGYGWRWRPIPTPFIIDGTYDIARPARDAAAASVWGLVPDA